MKRVFRCRLLLVLLLLISVSFPVYANNLIGDENGTAIGSTAVTARVEMSDSTDDPDDDVLNTGDDTEIAKYIFMILLSGIIIVSILEKHRDAKY